MKIKQTIHLTTRWPWPFEEGAEIEREDYFLGYPVYPKLFVCPWCHVVWAKITHMEPSPIEHEVIGAPCSRCKPCEMNPVPGSILWDTVSGKFDTDLLAALPRHLVEREFHLHLKAFSQESSNVTNHTTATSTNDPAIHADFKQLVFD